MAFWSNFMPIWNFNISSSLSGHIPITATFALRDLLFSPWVKGTEAWDDGEGQSRAGGGPDSSLCGGTESSGGLLNASSIWCHYRPSERRDPVLRWSQGLQAAGRVGEAVKKRRTEPKMLINKWEENRVADQRGNRLVGRISSRWYKKAAAWKWSCHRWRRTAEHNICSEWASVWVFNRLGRSDRWAICCRAEILCSDYKHTTARVALQSFLFFLLLEMDHVPTQAVYIYLSNLFNVPCVQNQNQSVHRLVPAKVLYR